MKVRDDVLTLTEDMGTSGTKQWDLDYADIISGLNLRFAGTNGSSGNKDAPLERVVSKIEIVDGAEVLWSLPGDVAYALFSQENGDPADEYMTGAMSDSPYVDIPIRFGRYLYDPELGFIPARFKNPQLKVTFDEATVRGAGDEGYSTDSITLTIVTRLMEDAPDPMGWLMARDLYDFTSAGSGDEKVPMPTDYPWRQLLVRNYIAGSDVRSVINAYKLSCDRGKFVPFDMGANAITDRQCQVYPTTVKAGYDNASHGETFQSWIGIDLVQNISSHEGGWIIGATSFWPGQFEVRAIQHDGEEGSERPVHWNVRGWCPHNTVFIPFGRLDKLEEWFQAPQYGNVDLYLTQGVVSAEVNVCVQQLRSY